MGLRYKIDVMKALKDKGITTYMMRKDKILSESTIQKLRQGIGISWENLETICSLLECQPSEIIEYIPEDTEITEQRHPPPPLPLVRRRKIFFRSEIDEGRHSFR